MMKPLRIALVVPHIFMHRELLPHVIFSPGELALNLADGLTELDCEITLYSPGPVDTKATNITADLSLFERELVVRGDSYLSLLKKHPFTFITLARQVQSELIARAYADANAGLFDIVHIYTNEEDTALPFAQFCRVPVVFTHHDPYNFLVKYKSVMPKYKHLNWISFSLAQRSGMPPDTNWLANIPHGLPCTRLDLAQNCTRLDLAQPYFAYLGRIIEPKGVHLAIQAVKAYNKTAQSPMKLKIAGKHYGDNEKQSYWETRIRPKLDEDVLYAGFLAEWSEKQTFLSNAAALIVPSIFDEPFGMVAIEALACGTPVIALDSGALPEIIEQDKTGFIAHKSMDAGTLNEVKTVHNLQRALQKWREIDRATCRAAYAERFTSVRMCSDYLNVYQNIANKHC